MPARASPAFPLPCPLALSFMARPSIPAASGAAPHASVHRAESLPDSPTGLTAALHRYGPLLSRIIAALFGGYALGALGSVATLALPMARTEAVIMGMLLSFLIHAGAVIWVFAVGTATRAWAGLGVAALPLLAAAASV